MGNDNRNENERIRINNEHIRELERLRKEADENKQKRLLDEKIAEYNFQVKQEEIRQQALRLLKLDEYKFKEAIEKLRIEEKKNDQFNQRETTKIANNHEEKMEEISNDKLKINNDFKQTIRKYDDDKEINTLRENNKYKYENEKMK